MVLFWHPIRRLLTLSWDTFLLTVRRWNIDVEMQAVFRLPFQLGLNPSEKLEAFPGHPFQSRSDVGNVWKRLGADGTRLHGWPDPRPVHGGPRRSEPETKNTHTFTLGILKSEDSGFPFLKKNTSSPYNVSVRAPRLSFKKNIYWQVLKFGNGPQLD